MEVEIIHKIIVIRFSKEVTIDQCKELYEKLRSELLLYTSIIVDLKKVTYISSSGIGLLLSFVREEKDVYMIIESQEDRTYKLLEQLNLLYQFKIVYDIKDAFCKLIVEETK